jgi:hypothetical protein
MSASTRSNGYDWRLKLLTVVTCTACSTNPDSIRFVATTCTVVGGFDSIGGLGGTFDTDDNVAFEDAMHHTVIGPASYGPVTASGTYDPLETSQKALFGEMVHEAGAATTVRPAVRVWAAVDTVNKRSHRFKGRLIEFIPGPAGARGKTPVSIKIAVDSIPQVCTTA